jgi:hypothetical protein
MGALQGFDKYTTQALGFFLIIIGVFPLFFGLQGGWTTCPPTGCPPSVISRLYWQSTISFFSGITLVTTGIVLLIAARQMKPVQKTDVAIEHIRATE